MYLLHGEVSRIIYRVLVGFAFDQVYKTRPISSKSISNPELNCGTCE
jgi:hypothetical protein